MRVRDELNTIEPGQIMTGELDIGCPSCAVSRQKLIMKILLIQILILLTSSVIVDLVHADEEETARVRDLDLNGSDCIWIRTIRDYRALDNRSLLIYGAGKSAYFVRLAHSSMELRSSFQVGFSSRDGQLCPYGGDSLVFGGGFSDEDVSIRAISRISEDQADDLLVRFGRKEPDEQHIPAPREVEGAEIEELD